MSEHQSLDLLVAESTRLRQGLFIAEAALANHKATVEKLQRQLDDIEHAIVVLSDHLALEDGAK